jgi:hypothetical protein
MTQTPESLQLRKHDGEAGPGEELADTDPVPMLLGTLLDLLTKGAIDLPTLNGGD